MLRTKSILDYNFTDYVGSIKAKTRREAPAGTDSPISIKVCSSTGQCCSTRLDNPSKDDFRSRHYDHYRGNLIGTCYKYPMTDVKTVSITNHGDDSWWPEIIWVYLGRDGYAHMRWHNYWCRISWNAFNAHTGIVNRGTKTFGCENEADWVPG